MKESAKSNSRKGLGNCEDAADDEEDDTEEVGGKKLAGAAKTSAKAKAKS